MSSDENENKNNNNNPGLKIENNNNNGQVITICAKCGDPGHASKDCKSTSVVRINGFYDVHTGISFGVSGSINNLPVPVIYFDEGAMVNIVDKELLKKYRIPESAIQSNQQTFTLADNHTKIKCLGTVVLDVKLGQYTKLGKMICHLIQNNDGNLTLGSSAIVTYQISRLLDEKIIKTNMSNEAIELLIMKNGKVITLAQMTTNEEFPLIPNPKEERKELDSEEELSDPEPSSESDYDSEDYNPLFESDKDTEITDSPVNSTSASPTIPTTSSSSPSSSF
jgi:hypothetical protein